MRDFTNKEQVSIYVETLFQLSRDAWRQGKLDAFEFISEHLVGLVPQSAMDGFMRELDPNHNTNARTRMTRKSRNNHGGGALVTNPVPDKPLAPAGGFADRW